ncbi:O-antigen ligase family protein [Devosia sediminis]|uniref:O-antigen ligase family protein n=1 Tax=Devosia sediminis TaxID=2798801 RepID=A0A934ITW5_9HYPH|nr:O-antigen ligase family protein [Devosia sediminis]MBJ3785061.1 O-antigen ligase family protein [Devosia sediminis]
MTAVLLRVALFAAFLIPVAVGDFSVNYSFVLYALFLALQAKHLERPTNLILWAIAAYGAIYLVGLGFDVFAPDGLLLRRGVSFAIFMTMFAFALVRFGELEVRAFKIAIVAVSFGFSLYAIARFYSVGGNEYGFALKDVTGSQRYGFVYLLAIFCLMSASEAGRSFQVLRSVSLFVVLAGLLLTFSRSSVVAFGCVLPLFLLSPLAMRGRQMSAKLAIVGRRTGIAALYTAVLLVVFPVVFQFYGDLILSRYTPLIGESLVEVESMIRPEQMTGERPASEAADGALLAEGSEGTRILIWKSIVNNTLNQPLTGTSYLGAWVLESVHTGSSHSQYFDVLLRTGFVGWLLYLAIIVQVLFFLWRKEPGLFWGTLAMLVFGIFHETFKESQGAFILACLIGMYVSHWRKSAGHVRTTPAVLRA